MNNTVCETETAAFGKWENVYCDKKNNGHK